MKHTHTHTRIEDAYSITYWQGQAQKQSPAFATVEDALHHLHAHVDGWHRATVKRLVGQGHRAIQGGHYPPHHGQAYGTGDPDPIG
jgi:hypothetical protein